MPVKDCIRLHQERIAHLKENEQMQNGNLVFAARLLSADMYLYHSCHIFIIGPSPPFRTQLCEFLPCRRGMVMNFI